jgi:hypothetical protein
MAPSEPATPSFTPAEDDSESAEALPVRGKQNGNANGSTTPANGASDDGADQAIPRLPAASVGPGASGPGPSRLPAFGGQVSQAPDIPQSPIGGQNVRGGDGPSAGDPAATGVQGSDGLEPKTEPGKVMVPPPATADQRLPIFDSLESDWFRRSGKTVITAGSPPGTQVSQTAAQPAWTSPADEGWRAAQALAAPSAGDTTQAGLPRRVPKANLVPGSVGGGGGDAAAEAPARSPDAVRTRMASFQRGVREGRAAAPQIEEPQDR